MRIFSIGFESLFQHWLQDAPSRTSYYLESIADIAYVVTMLQQDFSMLGPRETRQTNNWCHICAWFTLSNHCIWPWIDFEGCTYIYILLCNECLCFWSQVFHNILFTVYNMYNYKHSHMSLHLQVQYKIPLQNLVYAPRNQHGTWKIGLFQKDTGTSLPSVHFQVLSFREDMQHFFTPTLSWTSRRLVIIVQIPRDQPFVQGPFVQGPFRWHGSGRFRWFLLQFLQEMFRVGKNLEFEWGQWYYVDWLLGVWETILGNVPFWYATIFLILFLCTDTHVVQTWCRSSYLYVYVHVCRIRFHHTDSWDGELANSLSKAHKIT